jgi:4-amino-4-deoxy-L-arabinose transferase-like glycosyltransferase
VPTTKGEAVCGNSFRLDHSGEKTPRWAWFVLLFISLAVLVPGTRVMPLLDRDEPRFARATVEMEQRGNYIVPYFNDEYRFDKPPLTYWWMHLNYAVFGHNELGARMHSILSAAAIALLLLAIGRDLYGWRTGFWAGIAWVTLFQVWQHGRLAVADMPMVLSLVAAHWALWKLLTGDKWRRWGFWFWVLWLSLALGFLAKGPLVFFSVAFTLALLRLVFWRKPLEWGRLQILPGAAICILPIAAWGLPALAQTGGQFWHQGIGKHVVERGLGAFNDRVSLPVVFYIFSSLISLFPWMGRAGAACVAARECRRDMRSAYLLSWAAGPYIIFAFYATQLPHYVLPAFPALVLLLFAAPGMDGKWARRWFVGYHALFGAIIVGMAVWLMLGPVFLPIRPMMLGFCAVLMGLMFIAVSFERRSAIRMAMGIVMLIAGSMLSGIGMRRVAISPQIALQAQEADGALAAVGYTEPSLVYYAGRTWHMYPGTAEGLEEALLRRPAMIAVLRKQMDMNTMLGFAHKTIKVCEEALLAEKRLNEGYIHGSVDGLNIGRFTWASVDLYIDIDQLAPELYPQ